MRAFLEVHAPLIWRLARGEARIASDAGDVAQDVMTTLLRMHAEGRFDPALEVHFYPDQPGAFGTLRGLEGLARGWGEWLEPWESYRYEVEDYVDAGGGAVVVLARVRARTHRDSVEIEHAPAVVCQVRDGRLVRLDFYLERRDAPGDLG